jgi:large subunit ribosomal protein L9
MDVILLKDMERLGKEGTVVGVKPGFARNYLLPQGLALLASPNAMKAVEERTRQAQAKLARIRKQADQLKRKIEGRSLTLKLTLGEGDRPFGSITAHDIVQALAQEGLAVEKHAVGLEEPIKVLGIYEIPVRVHPEATATLKLWVVKA